MQIRLSQRGGPELVRMVGWNRKLGAEQADMICQDGLKDTGGVAPLLPISHEISFLRL
jgi:hypothetical protein